jgi:hypothetical protein
MKLLYRSISLKPQKKCRIFIYLKGRKFEWLFILIFFIA